MAATTAGTVGVGPPQQQWKPQPEWTPEPEPICPKGDLECHFKLSIPKHF